MSDYNNGQIWEMIWRLLHWIGMQEQEACMMKNDYIKLEKERDALEAKLAQAVEALESLIQQTHDCEKELTEDLHHVDFCGESEPLTKARATLAEIKGESHE